MNKGALILWGRRAALALFFLILAMLILASAFQIRILIEQQEIACLPYKVVAARFHHVEDFKRGDLVVFIPPHRLMGELFDNKIIVKMVGAIPGDTVAVHDGILKINGQQFGSLDIATEASRYLKRNIASFERMETVPPGMLLVVGTMPRAFDGRYWGFLPQEAVLGRAYPIY